MTYLKSFEIQYPDSEFEGLIYLLQDLTTEQNLELTKEGLQHIDDNFISNESVGCELQNNYDQGYDRGYADGKDEGYEDGFSEGEDTGYGNGYEKGYEDGKKDGFFNGKEAGYNNGYYDGRHAHETN